MKDRLKLIVLLVIMAAISILVVLGTWLYGSYHQRLGLFIGIAEQSLFEAVQDVGQEMEEDTLGVGKVAKVHVPWKQDLLEALKQHMDGVKTDDLDKLVDSVLMAGPERSFGRIGAFGRRKWERKDERPRYGHGRELPPDKEMPRTRMLMPLWHGSGYRMDDKAIARIKMYFQKHLEENDLHADYIFETKVHQFKAGDRPMPILEEGEDQLSLRPFLIDPERGLFIHIHFDRPWQYLLYSLSWQLIVSMFILAVITGTFLYLFITILRQNKLAVLRKAFVNSLTHELRTPVTTVYAAVEALQGYINPNDRSLREQYYAMAIEELDHLSSMIDRVLDIAEGDPSEEGMLRKEKVNLSSLIQKSVEHMQRARGAHDEFNIHLDSPVAEVFIEADPHHLKNVMNNLLDNAVKYGATDITVKMSVDDSKNEVRVTMTDNGIGIPLAYQQQVFEPFFRVPRGDLYSVKGFGLGLPYVRRVLQQHGGKVSLKSTVGQGTTFIITIPKKIEG